MKKKTIFHIGLHKNATTFLYKKVFTKVKKFAFIPFKNKYLKNAYLRSYNKSLIIGKENILGSAQDINYHKLKLIYKKNHNAIFIISLRKPSEYLFSLYVFLLQMGFIYQTLDGYLKEHINTLEKKLNYTNILFFLKKNNIQFKILFYENYKKKIFFKELNKFLDTNIVPSHKENINISNYNIFFFIILRIINYIRIVLFNITKIKYFNPNLYIYGPNNYIINILKNKFKSQNLNIFNLIKNNHLQKKIKKLDEKYKYLYLVYK